MHLESGVLTRLDDTMHTSYSFFPGSFIKKEVSMKFYQLPLTNFKLGCWSQPESILELMRNQAKNDATSKHIIMETFDLLDTMALAYLLVVLIPPFTCHCALLLVPLSIITELGMFVSMHLYLESSILSLDILKDALTQ